VITHKPSQRRLPGEEYQAAVAMDMGQQRQVRDDASMA
jgi:hypothetical protein